MEKDGREMGRRKDPQEQGLPLTTTTEAPQLLAKDLKLSSNPVIKGLGCGRTGEELTSSKV